MMNMRVIVSAVLLGCAASLSGAEPQSLNVVFIGDSITYGYLLTAPAEEAPPIRTAAVLQGMQCFTNVCFTNCGRNAFRTDQFLPERPGSAWPQVRLAGDSYTNKTGLLLFSIMLGANDSVVFTPAQYGSNLTSLVNALLGSYPNSQIVIHHPLWYSKVPSTRPDILFQYIPVIDALVGTFGQSLPGRVHLGDIKGWDIVEEDHEAICFKETRDSLPYYIHPNVTGATILGKCWAEAIYRAVVGVVAYWDFESGSNVVADAAGYGHALTNSGVSFLGGAALFSGTQAVFSTANTLDLHAYTNVTVEYFIRTASTNSSVVFEHSANAGSNIGAFCSAYSDFNSVGNLTGAFKTSGGYNIEATPGGVASNGQWHHVALVIDSSKPGADRVQLYFDQVRQTKHLTYNNAAFTTFRNETFYIGSRANSSVKFAGQLDDVRISNQALSPDRFLQSPTTNQASSIPPSGLPQVALAYWPFEPGAELLDATGNGNALTNQGVTFFRGAAFFSGAQTAFNTARTLDLHACTNVTVEYFIRTFTANDCIVFEHSKICNNNPGGFLSELGGFSRPGSVSGAFRTSAAYSFNIELTAAGVASDGQWHHVALVIDSTKAGADRAQLFFDKVRQNTYAGYTSDAVTSLRNETFYIGSRSNSVYKLTGQLDDVRVTGAALTVDQFLKVRSYPQGAFLSLR